VMRVPFRKIKWVKGAIRALWLIVLVLAFMMVMSVGQAILAAPEPAPSPNPYNAKLIESIPGLKGLSAPEWILPGYRLLYDVFYYDVDDNTVDKELLVIDILGEGDGYVLSSSKAARFDEEGRLLSLEDEGIAVDFAGIGEAWISPDAISDASAPAPASGLFHMGIFENLVRYDADGRAWVTTVEVEDAGKGSTSMDIYYGRKNGLALLFDIYVYGPTGYYIGGAAAMYKDFAVCEAPWMGLGFASVKEGSVLEYDMKLEYGDGKTEAGTARYTIVENHDSWMKVLEEKYMGGARVSERLFIASGFSADGLMPYLPGGKTEGLQDGFTYFYDGYTQAKVSAGGPVEVEGIPAYEILFEDGLSKSSASFREKDGLMVRYTKSASQAEPYVTTLVYKGSR